MFRALGQLWRLARARVTLGSVVAATPLFGLAVLYATVCGFGSTWGGRVTEKDLSVLLVFELVLMHAFPFLGTAALIRTKAWWGWPARMAWFWGLFALYCGIAYGEAGWTGVLTLLGMGLLTYVGLLFRGDTKVTVFREVGVRWLFATVTLFFGICAPYGMWVTMVQGRTAPSFEDHPIIGAPFFFLLAVYELFRVYATLAEIKTDRRARASSRRKRRAPRARAEAERSPARTGT